MKLLIVSHSVHPIVLCVALGIFVSTSVSSIAACAQNIDIEKVDFSGRSFAFYALSRGQGVPDETWKMLEQLRVLFADMQRKGKIVRLHDDRIGVEGETRLCADFATTAIAQNVWEQVLMLIQPIELELFNLKIEPCNSTTMD